MSYPVDVQSAFMLAFLIVPGYLTTSMANIVSPLYAKTELVNVLRCFSYSLFACLLASAAVVFWPAPEAAVFPLWFAMWVLIVSAILGLAVGYLRKTGLVNRVFSAVHLNINVSPSPWDYKFSQLKNGAYIEAVLVSGEVIWGEYSTQSFASSVSDEGAGLYLEREYGADFTCEGGEDLPGVFIPYSRISHLRFYDMEDCDVEEEQ